MWVEYDDGVSVVLEKFERFSTQQEALIGFREGKEPVTLGHFPGAECARLVLEDIYLNISQGQKAYRVPRIPDGFWLGDEPPHPAVLLPRDWQEALSARQGVSPQLWPKFKLLAVHCTLCGAELRPGDEVSHDIGRYTSPAGGIRFIIYSLCHRCSLKVLLPNS